MSALNIRHVISSTAVALCLSGCAVAPGLTDTEKELTQTMDRASFQPASRALRDGIETQEPLAQAAFWMREYELNPTDLEATIKLASVIRKVGNPQRAVEITQTTRALYPRDPYLTAEYAAALIASDRSLDAMEPLNEALAYAPAYGRLWSLKGAVLDQQEQYELARKHYTRALNITPNDPSVMANMGLSFALSGNPQMAEQWLRRAAAMPGASQSVRQNLGLVLQLQGKADEADKFFQQAQQQSSSRLANLNVQPANKLRGQYPAPQGQAPKAYPTQSFQSPPPMVRTQNSPSALISNQQSGANPYANASSASEAARIAARQTGQRPRTQAVSPQQKMSQEALLSKLAGNVKPKGSAAPQQAVRTQQAPYYPGRTQAQQTPTVQYQQQPSPYAAPQQAQRRGASRTRR